jgi:type VI secretion system protein ImpG
MKRDALLLYYERELRFIRKLASGFAEKYPEVASRLLLEPTKCEDPHVERLIEAFAMLTARVHLRIDDDFSEISDSLLGVVYPHYTRPVPSMTIVQLQVDPDLGAVEGGFAVEAGSLLHSRPVNGVRLCFRTAYPLRLFPVEVAEVEIAPVSALEVAAPQGAASALRIALRTQGGVPFSALALDQLRFFLDAGSGSIHSLYELFLRDPRGLMLRAEGVPPLLLPPESIRPVGFGRDEGLLEYPPESFLGYRLLQEYFSFPDKFLFVELAGLGRATRRVEGEELELLVFLPESAAQIDVRVEPENLKLGCTPAVNLFPHTADPIRVTQTAVEYPVHADARSPRAFEIYSIREVSSIAAGPGQGRSYAPFYGVRHGLAGDTQAHWYATRRPALAKGDAGTDVFLTLVDPDFALLEAPGEVLQVETLCTNRDLPGRLPFGDPSGDFQLEGRPGISRIVALRKPTDPLPPPIGPSSRWRLVSHLCLNYLSLIDGEARGEEESPALRTLHEILRLYDFADSAVTRQRIAGLISLRTRPVVRRIGRGEHAGFVRGVEAELEFDPSRYTGSGVFLFASVLERFLGLYTSLNSFTQTVAKVRHQPGELKRWAPRAGEVQVL